MKTLIALLLGCLPLAAADMTTKNEPPAPPAQKTAEWIANIDGSVFAAMKTIHPSTGSTEWGIGLDLGYALNKSVSLHIEAIGYSTDSWGGAAIDESSILVRANLYRYQERFGLYAITGTSRSWDKDDWGLGAGLGLDLKLTKEVSIGVDSRFRFWDKEQRDVLTRIGLTYRF